MTEIKKSETETRRLDWYQFLIPTFIAVGSFVLSGINYYENRKREWEDDRPLCNVSVTSQSVKLDKSQRMAVYNLTLSNEGQLSFIIRELKLVMSTTSTLTGKWDEITLIKDSLLPLGINGFVRQESKIDKQVTYTLEGSADRWHIIDPNRTVQFQFALPIEGHGVISIGGVAYLQTVTLESSYQEMEVPEQIKNQNMVVIPEFGGDASALSQEPLFPYSFQGLMVVSKGDDEETVTVRDLSIQIEEPKEVGTRRSTDITKSVKTKKQTKSPRTSKKIKRQKR